VVLETHRHEKGLSCEFWLDQTLLDPNRTTCSFCRKPFAQSAEGKECAVAETNAGWSPLEWKEWAEGRQGGSRNGVTFAPELLERSNDEMGYVRLERGNC
jgi:hypothetical protein